MIIEYLRLMEYLRPLLPFLILGTTAYFARRATRALEHRAAAQDRVGRAARPNRPARGAYRRDHP